MWRPPDRIRYSPRQDPWPSREEVAASQLFRPISVGTVMLAERTWVPAMVPWRACADGNVSQSVLDWYERFARGQPGALVIEATGVRDIPSGPLLRIGSDAHKQGLTALASQIKVASGDRTRSFIQLIDFLRIRRRPKREDYFHRFLTITRSHRDALGLAEADEAVVRGRLMELSDVDLVAVLTPREVEALQFGARERVTDVDQEEIATLPERLPGYFADAAIRARDCGFDGVELHFAHAYTLASFLSATNDRTDGYGGALANRLRLPLEVYQRVRAAVGRDFVIGCRFLADETIVGGNSVNDAVQIAIAFAKAGFDFLSLSRGGKFDDAMQPKVGEAAYPYTGRSGYECMPSYYSDLRGPFERNVPAVARIREAVRSFGMQTPVVAAGGIHTFSQAEGILARAEADIIGFARQALADPDWFRKVRSGRGAEVRLCQYTNYCEALDQRHREVTCELWDRLELDAVDVTLSTDKKRRLVAPAWQPQ